ncbi:MAG: hypothetical protein M1824_003651, partial [Vezdaea acicularis]
MLSKRWHLDATLVVALLFVSTQAAPSPQAAIVIGDSQSDVSEICALTYDDPGRTWENSGASFFLDQFLKNNTANNWANKIDQLTTDSGSQGTSNLDCVDLQGGNCPFPSIQCRFFTPPALFHIRNAISSCYGMFTAIHEALQDNAILTNLNINQIISDFGSGSANDNTSLFGALSAAFGIGAGFAAAVPEIGGPLAVVSGIFGLAGNTQTSPPDPTLALDKQLADVFSASEKQLVSTLATVFGGSGDTSTLPGVTSGNGPNGETQDIAKFFANGKFLINVSSQGAVTKILDPVIANGSQLMKQSLVGTVLKSQNYYIFVNTDRTENDCNGITGSRFINNQCFTIEQHKAVNINTFPISSTTQVIDKSKILKFDDPSAGYNINPVAFYTNADACQTAFPNFNGTVQSQALPTDGSLP